MNKKKVYIALLILSYILFSALCFFNGVVLLASDFQKPDVVEIIYRLITAVCWWASGILLMLKVEQIAFRLILLIPPIAIIILHCAGLVYMVTESAQSIAEDAVMLYPVLQFCFGVFLLIALLILFLKCCKRCQD